MRAQVDVSVAEGGIGVGAEVERVVSMRNQTHVEKGVRPDREFCNMQGEHEEDRPTEKKQYCENIRPPSTKAPLPALPKHEHKVETSAMQQHDKNQHDGAYTDGRHGLEFIWDLGQERWNITHAVTLLSHHYEERLEAYLPF